MYLRCSRFYFANLLNAQVRSIARIFNARSNLLREDLNREEFRSCDWFVQKSPTVRSVNRKFVRKSRKAIAASPRDLTFAMKEEDKAAHAWLELMRRVSICLFNLDPRNHRQSPIEGWIIPVVRVARHKRALFFDLCYKYRVLDLLLRLLRLWQ